jgi:hypothetical protein
MKREIYVMRKIFFIALSLLFCFFTACDNAPVDAPFPLDEEQIPLDDEQANNSERPIEQDDKLNVTADAPAVDVVDKLYIVEANIVIEETRAANGEIIQNYYRNRDYSNGPDVIVSIYSDGTATARLERVSLWSDYADPDAEGEQGKEGRRRVAIQNNMAASDRYIPSEGNKIIDIFIFPPMASIGNDAFAVIKCAGNIYYFVDLTGSLYFRDNSGKTPVIITEFAQLRGYDINSFLLKAADPDEPYTSDIYAVNASDSTETLVSPFREINEFLYYSSSHD